MVEVQWRVTGSSDQILNALYDVANNEKLLAPTYIGIKALPKKRRKKQQDYEISMDLRGYRALPMRELKARTEQR
ncbi:hypothetical protein [Salinivibrio socompensis]|uniref:hypothetical protein n=1 Tax=Salinivibrio socompensis TaxID=1510206 RepID=UPI00046FAB2F|nr:hypothetical protein [Salinivibrio socompensis]